MLGRELFFGIKTKADTQYSFIFQDNIYEA